MRRDVDSNLANVSWIGGPCTIDVLTEERGGTLKSDIVGEVALNSVL